MVPIYPGFETKKNLASEGNGQNLKCPPQKFGGPKICEKNIFNIRDKLFNNFQPDRIFQALLLFSEHTKAWAQEWAQAQKASKSKYNLIV